ncbi:MAG TPA: hypothetical protein VIZ68_04065 [Thermoplasmata archaeon]
MEGEVRALRQEVADLRSGQKEILRAVEEMTRTFRALAVHLGIASEPYKKDPEGDRKTEMPGFA